MIAFGHVVNRHTLRVHEKPRRCGGCWLPYAPGRIADAGIPRRMNHDYVASFPRRWVWKWDVHGVPCDLCGSPYRTWICPDATWARLPKSWRKTVLCTRCFRLIVLGPTRAR